MIDQENAGSISRTQCRYPDCPRRIPRFSRQRRRLPLPPFSRALHRCRGAERRHRLLNYYLAYAESGRRLPCPLAHRSCVLDRTAALRLLLRDTSLHFYFWNKLFRRSLFTGHGIEIPSICYEDIATTPRLFYYAERL